jgi:3-oxoadipate enol-lactonase
VSSSLEGLARCSVRPFLERIEAPTRLLYGEVDTVTPSREGFELAAGIRRASLRVFPGCGHLLHVEARDEVFAEVEGFLGAEIEPGESNR